MANGVADPIISPVPPPATADRLPKCRPDITIRPMPEASPDIDKRPADRPQYQPLVTVLVAVCAGIVADRFWPLPVFVWWATAGGAWVVWLGAWRRGWQRSAAALLLTAVAATAASWHHCRWSLFADDDLGHYARAENQPVCVEAIALSSARAVPAPDPDPMRAIPVSDRARLDLELTGLRDGIQWQFVSGRARLEVYGRLPGVRSGDRLRVFAQLSAPGGPYNPGEFDYARHTRAQRTRSRLQAQFPQCVSVVRPGHGWGPWQLIDRARSHGNQLLEQHLDRRRSALAAAVLLGARERLDPEQTQAFMQTGTIHLLGCFA